MSTPLLELYRSLSRRDGHSFYIICCSAGEPAWPAMNLLVTTIEKKQREDFAVFSRWAHGAWSGAIDGFSHGVADALP